jgi:hypothetical protein
VSAEGEAIEPEAPSLESTIAANPTFVAARRLVESVVVAVATSTGLYLVGSVYTEAYFGRLSIDAAMLDFAPPYIALQATHVVSSLLQYPVTLLVLYLLYRFLLSRARWWRTWYDVVHQRFGRLFLLVVNLLIVSPLVIAAIRAGTNAGVIFSSSILSEVSELMESFGLALLAYVVWLSFGPRVLILAEIRQHKLIPITLLFVLYLLDALITTADGAALDAALLMTGESDASIAVSFTLANDVRATLPDAELILIAARNGNYYVVERQPFPPNDRPVTYVVPFDAVDQARMQRINAAGSELDDIVLTIGEDATPEVMGGR